MELKSLEFVRVELSDGIAELRLCRPKALNALNEALLKEFEAALDELESFDTLRCMIVTGEGERAFVAGADIAEMSSMNRDQALAFSALGHRVCSKLERFPVPVLAAVNGYALGGGCEIALACDLIYASNKAKFGQPEVKLGLTPGFGGAVRLPRKIGVAAASEWIYTGEVFGAQSAQALGLVREVLPQDQLLERVRHIARLIATKAPLAVRAAKTIMTEGMSMNPSAACELERERFADLFDTEDMREGTRAFVEKKDPQFKGK